MSFVSCWTCETLTQALPTPAARAPESLELPGAPCRGRRIIPGHVDSRGTLKREMPSWPDQMGPQKLEGGWGTKGDRAGGRVSWPGPRVSERPSRAAGPLCGLGNLRARSGWETSRLEGGAPTLS